ncbi:MAG: type II toxin-antitoxin system HicA family toxin [Verrucomicrobiota bacterium]
MKRRALIGYLAKEGCELVREGGNHSWWRNRASNRRSAVPRHTEVNDLLVKKICKDLGIPEP